MTVSFNYNVSFSGRAVIPTEDTETAAETLNKMIEAREAGEEMDGFYKYLSYSEDLETFIQRCAVYALKSGIKKELVGGDFRNVGNIQVTING